jgi:serine/threonine protein kinase
MQNPSQLGKYQIKRELGKGAMGIVYEGLDPMIDRHVAIKVIRKSLINEADAQEVLGRFRREAQAAGRLNHPNIISVYEYGEDNDSAFIAMELVYGKELKEYFNDQKRFDIPFCIGIMQQLLGALEYSHSRGVVHRDIKPANIMITKEGQVKVADFGIAKIDSSDLTQAGTLLGTPTYMSPEQLLGVNVDHRSDIYSSGVILYQFLTGERPFTGALTTIMHKVLNQAPVPPITLNANVSVALNEVVAKAMAKRPEDRFQSAAEFMEALLQSANAAATSPTADVDATLLLGKPNITAQAPNDAMLHWLKIKGSTNPNDFHQFIANFPHSEFTGLAKQHAGRLTESIQRMHVEERLRSELETKRKKEIEEQAARSQRFAALKAAADAKHKAEQAEQAHRIQMKTAAKTGAYSAQTEPQPTAPLAKKPIAGAKPAPSVMPGGKSEKKGIFASLLSLFSSK